MNYITLVICIFPYAYFGVGGGMGIFGSGKYLVTIFLMAPYFLLLTPGSPASDNGAS